MSDRPFQVTDTRDADSLHVLSCSSALRNFEFDVELFTPALFLVFGRFDRDPAKEYNALIPPDRPKSARPFCLDMVKDKKFFDGLGASDKTIYTPAIDWDRRLYCINKEFANECFGFLSGIAISQPSTAYFAQPFSYRISAPDPVSKLERLSVTVFGILAPPRVAYITDKTAVPRIRIAKVPTQEDSEKFFADFALSYPSLSFNLRNREDV